MTLQPTPAPALELLVAAGLAIVLTAAALIGLAWIVGKWGGRGR